MKWSRTIPEEQALRARLRPYRLTIDEFDALMERQDGKCAVCQAPKGDRLVVDHDHRTGVARGLVCHRCNFALAYIEDPALVASAQAYLADTPVAKLRRSEQEFDAEPLGVKDGKYADGMENIPVSIRAFFLMD